MICVGLENVILIVQHLPADAVYADVPPTGLIRMTPIEFGRWECRIPYAGGPLEVTYYAKYGNVCVRLGVEAAEASARTNWDIGCF